MLHQNKPIDAILYSVQLTEPNDDSCYYYVKSVILKKEKRKRIHPQHS